MRKGDDSTNSGPLDYFLVSEALLFSQRVVSKQVVCPYHNQYESVVATQSLNEGGDHLALRFSADNFGMTYSSSILMKHEQKGDFSLFLFSFWSWD